VAKREPKPQPLHAQQVTFVAEQDGPIERDLKTKLTGIFRRSAVKEAFLARVDFGAPGAPEVALCIAGPRELPKQLLTQIGAAFSSAFPDREQLDVLLLTQEQHQQISAVCQAFFVK
jgi:hypothetical protein